MTNYNLQDFKNWLNEKPERSYEKTWTNFDFRYVWGIKPEKYVLLSGVGKEYVKTLQTWMEEVDKAERERERERAERTTKGSSCPKGQREQNRRKLAKK